MGGSRSGQTKSTHVQGEHAKSTEKGPCWDLNLLTKNKLQSNPEFTITYKLICKMYLKMIQLWLNKYQSSIPHLIQPFINVFKAFLYCWKDFSSSVCVALPAPTLLPLVRREKEKKIKTGAAAERSSAKTTKADLYSGVEHQRVCQQQQQQLTGPKKKQKHKRHTHQGCRKGVVTPEAVGEDYTEGDS